MRIKHTHTHTHKIWQVAEKKKKGWGRVCKGQTHKKMNADSGKRNEYTLKRKALMKAQKTNIGVEEAASEFKEYLQGQIDKLEQWSKVNDNNLLKVFQSADKTKADTMVDAMQRSESQIISYTRELVPLQTIKELVSCKHDLEILIKNNQKLFDNLHSKCAHQPTLPLCTALTDFFAKKKQYTTSRNGLYDKEMTKRIKDSEENRLLFELERAIISKDKNRVNDAEAKLAAYRKHEKELEEAETELDEGEEEKLLVLEQDPSAKLKREIEVLEQKVKDHSMDRGYSAYESAMIALTNKKKELQNLAKPYIGTANNNKTSCSPCQGRKINGKPCKKLAACHAFGNDYCHLHQKQAEKKRNKK